MSQAGRDAMASNGRRNSIIPGNHAQAPATTSEAWVEAAAQRRARRLALLLMAASATFGSGCIVLMLWWFT